MMKQVSDNQINSSAKASSSIRKLVGNAMSVLASDVTNRVATFVLYALIARYLGAFKFGQFSLALTFFQTFQLLAIGGMKTLVTREVARDKAQTGQYLVNGSAVIIFLSMLSILLLVLIARVVNYSLETTSIIMLLSLGLLPYALSVICDALFEAWERMYYITYANVLVNIFKVGLGFLLLWQGYTLQHVIILLFFSHVAVLGVKWWLLLRYIIKPQLRLDMHFCLRMLKATATFLGIDGLMAITSSFNIILLSKLASELEVGLLSAAGQLMVPISLVFQSILISVFPTMCRSYEPSFQRLKRISERLLELLLAIVVPTAAGLFFLAEPTLLFLFEDKDFSLATGALRIMVGVLIFRVFTQVLGRVLLASLQEKVTLRILTIDLLTNLILGPILISQYGLLGAALTTLLVRLVDFGQHYVLVSRMFSKIPLANLTWKPILASLAMSIYLMNMTGQNLFLNIASAGTIYMGILFLIVIWTIGGPQKLKNRYLSLWAKS